VIIGIGRTVFNWFRRRGRNDSDVNLASVVRCWPGDAAQLVLGGRCMTAGGVAQLMVSNPPAEDFATSSMQINGTIDLPEECAGLVVVRCAATLAGRARATVSCGVGGGANEDVGPQPLTGGKTGRADLLIPVPRGARSLTVALKVDGAGRFGQPRFNVLALGTEDSALRDLYALGFEASSRLSVAAVAARHDAAELAAKMEELRQALELERLPENLVQLVWFLDRANHYRQMGASDLATIDIDRHSIIMPPARPAHGATLARSKRIAYCVHSALPYYTHGYSTRTQGVAHALCGAGWDLRVYSRLGFPDDVDTALKVLQPPQIDGVPYVTSRLHPLHGLKASGAGRVLATSEYFSSVLRDFDPAVVHGASNWTTGLAAILAARNLGRRSVYEVRGLWHLTRASNVPGYEDTEDFAESRRLELECCHAADRVITITQALKRHLVELGVEASKISVAPNGVDPAIFVPRPRDSALLEQIGLQGRVVFGFVGSLVRYEGVDLLLDAVARLPHAIRAKTGVLIVGHGVVSDFLRQHARQLGISDVVRFTGRVPFEDVPRYYSIIDVAPFPRRSLPVTELVSPLKPFEAMAMGKIVIASNVEAHKEFIEDGVNGRLFRKDDVRALARVMQELVEDPCSQSRLREAAREFVQTRRTWSHVTSPIGEVYRELGAG
jgi:glycosyltransferase involved in cell wall biosynthesis